MSKKEQNSTAGQHKHEVLLVEDHLLVLTVLNKLVNRQSDFIVTGEAMNVSEARQAVERLKPEIIVLDLELPDGHGLELIKDIRARSLEPKILVFTTHDEDIFALRTLRAGANGYVMKRDPMERFLEALRQVASGNYAVNPRVWTKFLEADNQLASNGRDTDAFESLTDRELEVFELIGKGAGTREIAAYLNRSVSVIETCRVKIKEKLQLRSAAELVCHAVRWTDYKKSFAG